MIPVQTVIDQTGLDLSDPKLTERVLAPALGDRLGNVIPAFAEAATVIKGMMTAAATLGAATTVAGGVGAMVAAVQAARSWLDGRVDAAYSKTLENSERAREKFVATYYQAGAWSSVLQSGKSPSPAGLSLTGGTKQYDPYFTFEVDKAAGKNRIVPTWRTPPYDGAGETPANWQGGVAWPPEAARKVKDWRAEGWPAPARAPLSGYRGVRKSALSPSRPLVDAQPPVPAIPAKYVDKYWGNAPGNDTSEFNNRYDTSLFLDGMGIPPGYAYLFSWGTYPYLSWSTNSEGYYSLGLGGGLGKLDLSAAAAAVAAAIHSITPIHARISAEDVARCYLNWTLVSGIRELPPIPKGQVSSGVYLDEKGLPWAPGDVGYVPLGLCEGKPAPPEGWGPDAACPLGVGHKGGFSQIPWRVARDIELSFRSFFQIRRALIFQWTSASPEVRKAAKTGSDFALTALAAGVPLADLVASTNGVGLLAESWTRVNPLGWPLGKVEQLEQLGQVGGPQGFKATGTSRPSSGGLLLGAGALALWWARRKSSR